jgi:Zn-dependent protease
MAPERSPTPRRWSFPIGRVAGIEIRVHASFFLLVGLFVAVGLAPEGPGVVSALVWLVLVFAAVVFHELAHCFVGRRRGAVVHEIDLLPIGGVSRLERLPEGPADEFATAIAGPLSSVLLGLTAGAVAVMVQEPLTPIDLTSGALLPRFAFVNLLLAAFNMLPAFPLDGGRVLRALLERRYDLERATRIAATTGRWFAGALVVAGLFLDVWLVLIGVFIYMGANAEERSTLVHLRLGGHRVRDVMVRSPALVEASTPVSELRRLARQDTQRAYPVVCGERVVGLVDVGKIAFASDRDTAGDVAIREGALLAPDDDLEGSLVALQVSPIGVATVVDRDRVIGLLRAEDVQHLVFDPAPGSSGDDA